MAFTLPNLPYGSKGLEPHISSKTLDIHHGKHHATYVNNLNKLLDGSDLANASLEDVIKTTALEPSKTGIFNNAAQVWNHTFYWHSMKASGGGQPVGTLAQKIDEDFGSFGEFIEQFKQGGATQFGSGWVWLVLEKNNLSIVKTGNAETPLTKEGITPLITCDVWEHAYYLDYQNRRPDYLTTFLSHLINWDFAAENFKKAL